MLSSRQDLLRGVQSLLTPPVDVENATAPDVIGAGGKRCRDLCGGSFNWPVDETAQSYGTEYLDPRLLVGRFVGPAHARRSPSLHLSIS
jgi:hypothetical protein